MDLDQNTNYSDQSSFLLDGTKGLREKVLSRNLTKFSTVTITYDCM